jgi:hypothetical protein
MSHLSLSSMRQFLYSSISSINQNKLNGMIAEIDLRNTLNDLGFSKRISPGGWIVRNVGPEVFGHHTSVFFPETIKVGVEYPDNRNLEEPPRALHTICATMHQIGIHSYYCIPAVIRDDDSSSVKWYSTQLGIPSQDSYHPFPENLTNYGFRTRNYNFLRYKSDSSLIPEIAVPEEFSKEHIRVHFQNKFMCEMSDIDAIFWGEQYTYPIEIKEKTAAEDKQIGEYFEIEIKPFVSIAKIFHQRENQDSLIFIRENEENKNKNKSKWWFTTLQKIKKDFDRIGGQISKPMNNKKNPVFGISKDFFLPLNKNQLMNL